MRLREETQSQLVAKLPDSHDVWVVVVLSGEPGVQRFEFVPPADLGKRRHRITANGPVLFVQKRDEDCCVALVTNVFERGDDGTPDVPAPGVERVIAGDECVRCGQPLGQERDELPRDRKPADDVARPRDLLPLALRVAEDELVIRIRAFAQPPATP